MAIPKIIEQKVHNGLVLDEHGGWVPISEKIKQERCILEQLEIGNVIVDEKWIPISEALEIHSKKHEKSLVKPEPVLENDIPFPPETVSVEVLNNEILPETVVLSIEENADNKNEISESDLLSQIADTVNVNDTVAKPNSDQKK